MPRKEKLPPKPLADLYNAHKRTPEERAKLAAEIIGSMHVGLSMNKACETFGVPTPTFMDWVNADKGLAEKYAKAREALVERMADELLEIADAPVGSTDSGATDSGAVAKQRLQVDARKWLLSKLAPRRYGDKVENTVVGKDGGPVEMVTSITVNGVRPK